MLLKCRQVPLAWVQRCNLSENSLLAYTDQLANCANNLNQPHATFWMPAIRNCRLTFIIHNYNNLRKGCQKTLSEAQRTHGLTP